jgi:hypothetical protein
MRNVVSTNTFGLNESFVNENVLIIIMKRIKLTINMF